MMATVKSYLGSLVTYTDKNGNVKPAWVAGDNSTYPDMTGPGTASLYILSPRSGGYIRNNIPAGEGPGTFAATTKAMLAAFTPPPAEDAPATDGTTGTEPGDVTDAEDTATE